MAARERWDDRQEELGGIGVAPRKDVPAGHPARGTIGRRRRRLHFGKIVAGAFVAGLLIFRPAHLRSAQASDSESAAEPSILRGYIRAHKQASIQKEALGELKAQDGTAAKFVAMVASDPKDPSSGAKGIVVRLRNRSGEAVIYLDDDVIVVTETERRDSLKEFHDDLSRLAAEGENVFSDFPPPPAPIGLVSTTVHNREDPSQPYPRPAVLEVGWYRRESERGVAIASRWTWFHFPGADLTQVRDMIAKGRRFLASH